MMVKFDEVFGKDQAQRLNAYVEHLQKEWKEQRDCFACKHVNDISDDRNTCHLCKYTNDLLPQEHTCLLWEEKE